MIKPVMSWAEVDKFWAHISETLRSRLPVNDDLKLDLDGNLVQANRPMLEEIVCLRAAHDGTLGIYLAAIGVTLSNAREPKVIETTAKNVISMGQGGQHVIR